MEGGQSEIVGEAASCSVVAKELKEDLISVSRKSDPLNK